MAVAVAAEDRSTAPPLFLWGAMGHPEIAVVVFGAAPAGTPARLAGHALDWAPATGSGAFPGHPALRRGPGHAVAGRLVRPGPEGAERHDLLAAVTGLRAAVMAVETPAGPVLARVHLPEHLSGAEGGSAGARERDVPAPADRSATRAGDGGVRHPGTAGRPAGEASAPGSADSPAGEAAGPDGRAGSADADATGRWPELWPELWPETWARDWAPVLADAARAILAAAGREPLAALQVRYPMALARAASRLRAGRVAPLSRLRRQPVEGDVDVDWLDHPYQFYFGVEEAGLRFRRFGGGLSDPVRRAVFVMADAVTVLPYDPRRDRVLVIEQFRAGPFLRGDPNPWSVETIAGRIDPGESAEAAARREAEEEAGIALDRLLPVPGHYPSPGAITEFIEGFIGIAELPDGTGGIGGLASEGEDIRSHVIGFDRLMELVETGEACNGPLVVVALWLAARRDRLRAEAGV